MCDDQFHHGNRGFGQPVRVSGMTDHLVEHTLVAGAEEDLRAAGNDITACESLHCRAHLPSLFVSPGFMRLDPVTAHFSQWVTQRDGSDRARPPAIRRP
jgi:hypothetical protein